MAKEQWNQVLVFTIVCIVEEKDSETQFMVQTIKVNKMWFNLSKITPKESGDFLVIIRSEVTQRMSIRHWRHDQKRFLNTEKEILFWQELPDFPTQRQIKRTRK